MHLSFKGEFPLWVDRPLSQFLGCLGVGVARRQSLADGAGLLWAQVQRLKALSMVEFAQVLLRLLCHNDVDASDGFADDAAESRKKKRN